MLALPAIAQTPAARTPTRQAAAQGIPRTPDGKPNFNGIWQSMNTANWDLEDHSAQAGPVVAAGAIGAEPAGLGIIEGSSTIPYKPEALKKRDENFKNRAKEDPEVKCFLPGSSSRNLHAVSIPDRAVSPATCCSPMPTIMPRAWC